MESMFVLIERRFSVTAPQNDMMLESEIKTVRESAYAARLSATKSSQWSFEAADVSSKKLWKRIASSQEESAVIVEKHLALLERRLAEKRAERGG